VTYVLHKDAGDTTLNIRGDLYRYLIKVRRHGEGDILDFRADKDLSVLHRYELVNLESRSIKLSLLDSIVKQVFSEKYLHIAWCVIDSKSVEKVLPSLSEIGVSKISFIYCDRSQKNFKADFNRLNRIQEASMQQSGRSTFIEFDTYKNIQGFIKDYPETKIFDFCDTTLGDTQYFKTILIGCEGGFSFNERELLANLESFRLNTPMVLRSESAVMAVASKILL